MRHTTLILTVVASALTIAATTARAQAAAAMAPVVECGPGTAYPNCEDVPRPRSRLFEGIELTGTQQDSIDAITRRYRALQGRVNAQSLPVDAHNAQVLALRARDIAEKRKVMTPAQLPERPSIWRIQSVTTSSTSVSAGLDCHASPMTPRPVLT